MSCADDVVYHEVTPGEPEQNGRCCLNGVVAGAGFVVLSGVARRVSVGGSTIGETVGPLVALGLELDVSGEIRRKMTADAL